MLFARVRARTPTATATLATIHMGTAVILARQILVQTNAQLEGANRATQAIARVIKVRRSRVIWLTMAMIVQVVVAVVALNGMIQRRVILVHRLLAR